MIYKIKSFQEIDYINIDVRVDQFEFSDGKLYKFSDFECDYCNAGGTVLASTEKKEKYICVQCENELVLRKFVNDIIAPMGDTFEFLLPKYWNKSELDDWYAAFREERLNQEEVRKKILLHGKG